MVNTLFGDEIISSTDLKNNQKKWFDRALKAPVSITNTAGRQLVLMNREQVRNLLAANDYARRILQYCREVKTGAGRARFASQVYPWTRRLSPEDRLEFANEMVSAFVEAMQSNAWSGLDEIVVEWEATAEALADKEFMEVVDSKPADREYAEVE